MSVDSNWLLLIIWKSTVTEQIWLHRAAAILGQQPGPAGPLASLTSTYVQDSSTWLTMPHMNSVYALYCSSPFANTFQSQCRQLGLFWKQMLPSLGEANSIVRCLVETGSSLSCTVYASGYWRLGGLTSIWLLQCNFFFFLLKIFKVLFLYFSQSL